MLYCYLPSTCQENKEQGTRIYHTDEIPLGLMAVHVRGWGPEYKSLVPMWEVQEWPLMPVSQVSGVEISAAYWPTRLASYNSDVRVQCKTLSQGNKAGSYIRRHWHPILASIGASSCPPSLPTHTELPLPSYRIYEKVLQKSFTWMWLSLSVGIQMLVYLAKL